MVPAGHEPATGLVVPAGHEAEPAVPADLEAEPAVPAGLEAEPAVPAGLEAEPASPAECATVGEPMGLGQRLREPRRSCPVGYSHETAPAIASPHQTVVGSEHEVRHCPISVSLADHPSTRLLDY